MFRAQALADSRARRRPGRYVLIKGVWLLFGTSAPRSSMRPWPRVRARPSPRLAQAVSRSETVSWWRPRPGTKAGAAAGFRRIAHVLRESGRRDLAGRLARSIPIGRTKAAPARPVSSSPCWRCTIRYCLRRSKIDRPDPLFAIEASPFGEHRGGAWASRHAHPRRRRSARSVFCASTPRGARGVNTGPPSPPVRPTCGAA